MSPLLGCLLVLASLQVPRGAIVDPSTFRFSHEIDAAPPGLSVMIVDMAVLSNSRADLGDLRIVDSTDHQVPYPVSYTHLRAHETPEHLVCRLLLEKKKK